MTGFAPDWLDLREPADMAARDARLLRLAAGIAALRPYLPIVDLGCGTGSTARAMGAELPAAARWRLVDNDPSLLDLASERLGDRAERVVADLLDVESLPIDGASLVTGSALFDLVSADWVARFVARLARTGAPLYAALTYDGRSEWAPPHSADNAILEAFNRHQRTDKGLGSALGPDAPEVLAAALEGHGYRVETAKSDWQLGPAEAALIAEHARGVAGAAIEAGIDRTIADDWLRSRTAVDAAASAMVGHVDLLATRTA